MFGSLRTRSHYSFLQGASSPWELASEAKRLGHGALGLCDRYGVYGAVQLEKACRSSGLHHCIGAQVQIRQEWISIIARTQHGYASLNEILTRCYRLHQGHRHSNEHEHEHEHEILQGLEGCSIVTTDPSTMIILKDQLANSGDHDRRLDYYIGLDHREQPGSTRRLRQLVEAAQQLSIPTVIAPDVCYASSDSYAVYDAMTCIRLGISIFDPHPERPVNDSQRLRQTSEWLELIPYPDALRETEHLIEQCAVSVIASKVTPPVRTDINEETSAKVLRQACESALQKHQGLRKERYNHQLQHELAVIEELELDNFFLVVKDIVDEATRRGIRCSGRGSAANSLVAYLLGITHVCPIEHRLLFERFLHRGRKGMPDIDVDFDSERRQEIIEWMEQKYGREHAAMTATVITYRHRMAIRDCAKALGWSTAVAHQLSKSIPGYTNKELDHYRSDLVQIVGEAPLVDTLLRIAKQLLDRPRHLGLHSGGVILSTHPLTTYSPIQYSANGVSVVQFDKDDVESMGLIKFDVLGLRMLSCISEAVELIAKYDHIQIDPDTITLDDPTVYEYICTSNTIGVFQIESQGQMHLLAQHQPTCFHDLVVEVALFRPGPLQSGMVHPYIRRRKGLEPISYLHPDLEPILRDTLGIVLFQEQVLEIAHQFAGMPLDEADDFRALVSKQRDQVAIAVMKDRFVQGAVQRGVDPDTAEQVYDVVSHFVGYGFCRSHAAAFARIVYSSAWLKVYYPAAYMAACMQHRPGMYNLMTLEQEARSCGIEVLPPCLNRSGIRYALERQDDTDSSSLRYAIRKPLTSIRGMQEACAREIVWERARRPFHSIQDVVSRVQLSRDLTDAIALSGAFDVFEKNPRRAMWIAGAASRVHTVPSGQQRIFNAQDEPAIDDSIIPALADVTAKERLAYDYRTHGAARVHPMVLYRRELNTLEVRPIATAYSIPISTTSTPSSRGTDTGIDLTLGGIVILRQSPPTAHGVLFVTLEDETGHIQCIVQPKTRERYTQELRNAALVVRGRIYAVSSWRGLIVHELWAVQHVIGGYHGHPSQYGGTDSMELQVSTLFLPDALISSTR